MCLSPVQTEVIVLLHLYKELEDVLNTCNTSKIDDDDDGLLSSDVTAIRTTHTAFLHTFSAFIRAQYRQISSIHVYPRLGHVI